MISSECIQKVLTDARLSSDSVRVLLYVLSTGDEYPDKTLALGLKRSGYERVLKELEGIGYLKRIRKKLGQRGWMNFRTWYQESQVAQCLGNPETIRNVIYDNNVSVYDDMYNDNDDVLIDVSNDIILQNFNSVVHGITSEEEVTTTASVPSGGCNEDSENAVSENLLFLEETEFGLEGFNEGFEFLALANGISLDAIEMLVEKGIWKRESVDT